MCVFCPSRPNTHNSPWQRTLDGGSIVLKTTLSAVDTPDMTATIANHFSAAWLNRLLHNPESAVSGSLHQHPYKASIVIPNFKQRISAHYQDLLPNGLDNYCAKVEIPCQFAHFGLEIYFDKPVEIMLHDDDMQLDPSLHHLMAAVGPVVFKNVYFNSHHRSVGHRNRFPNLNFHVDRTANQPTPYSMYARDPKDPEQMHPRTASTLMTANIVGHLQALHEGIVDHQTVGVKATYTIFTQENMDNILNNVVLDQSWDEPTGVGEVAMQDNRTCLHASYYRDPHKKGYRIGVRYVG